MIAILVRTAETAVRTTESTCVPVWPATQGTAAKQVSDYI